MHFVVVVVCWGCSSVRVRTERQHQRQQRQQQRRRGACAHSYLQNSSISRGSRSGKASLCAVETQLGEQSLAVRSCALVRKKARRLDGFLPIPEWGVVSALPLC